MEHKPKYTVSEIVTQCLQSLSLRHFPTGNGSWRPTNVRQKSSLSVTHNEDEDNYVLDIKSAQHETIDALLDVIKDKLSPFRKENSWSSQVTELRELCVRNEQLSRDPHFIASHLRHLDLSDMRINQVNSGCLLKFSNLEELSLCANFIAEISSNDLPSNLRSLDVSSNNLSSICALTDRKLAALQHLALKHNQLDDRCVQYLKAPYWPSLVSIDLSYNHLSELQPLILTLKQLSTLRILLLRGNPLTLVPGYRGYVVDSLKSLTVLDDVQVTPDEKYIFRNFANRKETHIDGAKVRFDLRWIRCLPIPEELLNSDQPDYPMTSRKYFVQFHFIDEEPDGVIAALVKSDKREFSEDHITVDWHQVVTRKKLRSLRDFFMVPLQLDLVEEKTLLYPKDSEELARIRERNDTVLTQFTRPTSDTGKEKDKKGKPEDRGGAKPAGKKGKRDEVELVALPSDYSVVCSWNFDISELLSDFPFVEGAFTKGSTDVLPPSTFTELIQQELEQREGGGKKKEKKKPAAPVPAEPKKDSKGKKIEEEVEKIEEPVPLPQVCIALKLLKLSSSGQILQE